MSKYSLADVGHSKGKDWVGVSEVGDRRQKEARRDEAPGILV